MKLQAANRLKLALVAYSKQDELIEEFERLCSGMDLFMGLMSKLTVKQGIRTYEARLNGELVKAHIAIINGKLMFGLESDVELFSVEGKDYNQVMRQAVRALSESQTGDVKSELLRKLKSAQRALLTYTEENDLGRKL